MKKAQPEANEQSALFAWAAWEEKRIPELRLMYHVANGGSRNALEAANLKRQGVKAGVPDICLPVARHSYHGLYIEMKAGKNRPTQLQIEWLLALQEQGYLTAVCYSSEEAITLLTQYFDERAVI